MCLQGNLFGKQSHPQLPADPWSLLDTAVFSHETSFLFLIHSQKSWTGRTWSTWGSLDAGFFLSQSSLAGAGDSAPPQADDHRIMELFGLEKTQRITLDPAQRGLYRGTHWFQCWWPWQKSQELNYSRNLLLLPPLRSTQALPACGAVLLWRQKTFAIKPWPHEKFLHGEIPPKTPLLGGTKVNLPQPGCDIPYTVTSQSKPCS